MPSLGVSFSYCTLLKGKLILQPSIPLVLSIGKFLALHTARDLELQHRPRERVSSGENPVLTVSEGGSGKKEEIWRGGVIK